MKVKGPKDCTCFHHEYLLKSKATKNRKAYINKVKNRIFKVGCPIHAKSILIN